MPPETRPNAAITDRFTARLAWAAIALSVAAVPARALLALFT